MTILTSVPESEKLPPEALAVRDTLNGHDKAESPHDLGVRLSEEQRLMKAAEEGQEEPEIPETEAERKERYLDQAIFELLKEATGKEDDEVLAIMSDPNDTFRTVVGFLANEVYKKRSINRVDRENDSQMVQHFATRNANRQGIDLHFEVTKNEDKQATKMSVVTRLENLLAHPLTISSSGPDGELSIEMAEPESVGHKRVEIDLDPEEEVRLFRAVLADIVNATSSSRLNDRDNHAQAKANLKKVIDPDY